MIARFLRPGPPLAGFVDCLWYYDAYNATHTRELALPTGTLELVINLAETETRMYDADALDTPRTFESAIVCGAYNGYFGIDTAEQVHCIGVHFRPGGAVPFLGPPAPELTDRHVDLSALRGDGARGLRERLLDEPTPERRLAVLERILIQRLRRAPTRHPAVAAALRAIDRDPALARVAAIGADSGYSTRRFNDLFQTEVGLTPKRYCRVMRFSRALEQYAREGQVSWARVAADGGYYDQAHLTRDFRQFCGRAPGDYRPVSPDRIHHVALD